MDYKLELLLLPVTDVDQAKDFYATRAGFAVDVDHRAAGSPGARRIAGITTVGSALFPRSGLPATC